MDKMDFTWLLKSLCSKDEFYIFLISLTVALTCDYFKIVDMPWLLVLLYVFLSLTFICFLCKWMRLRINKAKDVAKKKHASQLEKLEREKLINIHFVGMDVVHKIEALAVISQIPPVPDTTYDIVVKDSFKYRLTNYDDGYNNPFYIQVNMGYYTLVYVTKQSDYSVLHFDPLFYNLIKSHEDDIINEYAIKYPEQYNRIMQNR